MTTIAYRDGELAADKRGTNSGWKQPWTYRKLTRLPDGSICAICGSFSIALALVDWLIAGGHGERPKLEDCTVVRLMPDRSILLYEPSSPPFSIGSPEFGAWGSGSPVAHGALAMGACAAQAVEIAGRFDDATGDGVNVMALAAASPPSTPTGEST